jgi:hypothetical protein
MDNINSFQVGEVDSSYNPLPAKGDGISLIDLNFASNTNYSITRNVSSGTNKRYDVKNINNGWEFVSDHERKIKKSVEKLIGLIFSEEYIDGEISKSQIYLENLYYQDQEIFFEVFSRASVSIYKEDNHYITTFINVASSIEYDWLKHRADLMIMSFNSLDDAMVNEATIRAVESWERKDHIPILEKMRKFDSEWVEEYKLAVLEYLRGL